MNGNPYVFVKRHCATDYGSVLYLWHSAPGVLAKHHQVPVLKLLCYLLHDSIKVCFPVGTTRTESRRAEAKPLSQTRSTEAFITAVALGWTHWAQWKVTGSAVVAAVCESIAVFSL